MSIFGIFDFRLSFAEFRLKVQAMRRTDLTEATMQSLARLDASQRQRFFELFLNAALRLDRLELRAWLRRRLQYPPLAAPFDPSGIFSDDDMAASEVAAGPDGDKAIGG